MYYKINFWKGRLGNNINQIIHIIIVAKLDNKNIKLKKHEFFDYCHIILFKKLINNKNIMIQDRKNQFASLIDINIKDFDPILLKKIQNLHKLQNLSNIIDIKFIKKKLQKLFYIKKYKKYNNKTLIIYIRSGDLFPDSYKQTVHPKYISAPYYYYEYILNKYQNNYKDFILVSEDNRNPVIKLLLKKYPYIKWTPNTLEDDLKIILGASDIVSCIGTFIQALSWVSKNMTKVYLPSYVCKKKYYPELEIEKIDLYDFKEKIGSWKNTKDQHNLLLNFIPNKLLS